MNMLSMCWWGNCCFIYFLNRYNYLNYLFIFVSWPQFMAYRISVPWPRIKPVPPALETQNLNHLTTSEAPLLCYFKVTSARVPNLPEPVLAVLGGSVRMEKRENWSWWESEERMRRVDFSVSTIKYWSQEAECGLHRWCLHGSFVKGKQLSGSFENQISYLISWLVSL